MNFGEVITAMVTPFNDDGKIDFSKLTILIEYLINHGTDALIIAGTTGESPTLNFDEKKQLFEYVVQIVQNRIPVVAGTGTYSTSQSIELTKIAGDIGVDGIMAVTPYYNKPNQSGLIEHFTAIAKNTKLPIMLYNIPGRSMVNMDPDTVVELSAIPNITSIKEASGNLEQVAEIVARTPDHFTLYSGDDSLTLPILSVGGFGVVSVASHIIGNEMKQMITNFLSGNINTAINLHQKLLPIMIELFKAPSPTPIKTALNILGIDVGPVRLPLVSLTEAENKSLIDLLSPH